MLSYIYANKTNTNELIQMILIELEHIISSNAILEHVDSKNSSIEIPLLSVINFLV